MYTNVPIPSIWGGGRGPGLAANPSNQDCASSRVSLAGPMKNVALWLWANYSLPFLQSR